MTWFNLLKQPTLKPVSRITTNLSNVTTNDEDCKEAFIEWLYRNNQRQKTSMTSKEEWRKAFEGMTESFCGALKYICEKDTYKLCEKYNIGKVR